MAKKPVLKTASKSTKTSSQPDVIKKHVVGKMFTAIIDGKKHIVALEKENKEEVVKQIEKYNLRNSQALKEKIIKLLTPKKEKEKEEILVKKKVAKKNKKEAIKELKAVEKELAQGSVSLLSEEEEAFFKSHKLFNVNNRNLYLKPFDKVALPRLLCTRLKEFISAGTSLDPLINFWKLALLNPNEIARTKLFDYLSGQNLTLTPNGYIVTYRMVKKTTRVTVDNKPIYTSARTGKEDYVIGTAFRMPRTECDEDGANDCSRGLHTGTHRFIGIVADKKALSELENNGSLGEGYGKGFTITTKTITPDSYGTGYDAPRQEEVKQNFDHTFGNQAVICLVNPMHVVSVPNSDTRKMRSCELFFAATVESAHVIDMVEKDYHIYDHAYKEFEVEQINNMLKTTKLKEHISSANTAKTLAKRKEAQAKLDNALSQLELGKDKLNLNQLDIADVVKVLADRVKKVK